jgi:hypothetical protein
MIRLMGHPAFRSASLQMIMRDAASLHEQLRPAELKFFLKLSHAGSETGLAW